MKSTAIYRLLKENDFVEDLTNLRFIFAIETYFHQTGKNSNYLKTEYSKNKNPTTHLRLKAHYIKHKLILY